MAYTVIIDANVLYDASARDLLVRFGAEGLVRARWTDEILDECFHALGKNNPKVPAERLARTRQLLCEAIPDCLITGYQPLVESITLPDLADRHVVAAAIKSEAQAIVTFNVDDFPSDAIHGYHLEATHPDDFFVNQIDLDPAAAIRIVQQQAADLVQRPKTARELVDGFATRGLALTATRLRELLDQH